MKRSPASNPEDPKSKRRRLWRPTRAATNHGRVEDRGTIHAPVDSPPEAPATFTVSVPNGGKLEFATLHGEAHRRLAHARVVAPATIRKQTRAAARGQPGVLHRGGGRRDHARGRGAGRQNVAPPSHACRRPATSPDAWGWVIVPKAGRGLWLGLDPGPVGSTGTCASVPRRRDPAGRRRRLHVLGD